MAAPTQECVFCGIVAGARPASVVHDGDTTLAFMDISPVTQGHLLVIPKRHAVGLRDMPEADAAAMYQMGHRLARAMYRSGVPCEGVNLFLADGVAAGQEVFHVHLHVLPRFDGDGFRLEARFGSPDRDELNHVASLVSAALAAVDG
jgi:diadenosine tetraphosphate (Ap4A) HIT family hydrolase